MNKTVDLKDAFSQLEVDVAALAIAEQEVDNWNDLNRDRLDGSGAQDERHERMGEGVRERALQARQKVNSQKALISKLLSAI